MSDEKKSLINIELIPKELITNIFGPSSKAIGEGLGGIANYVMGPLRRLNVISEKSYTDFVEKINSKTEIIPPDNRDNSKFGLSLKTMEDARYQLEEERMREYFANLLAGLVDNRKNQHASPRFSTILSELTTEEATLLSKVFTLHAIPTSTISIQIQDGSGVNAFENILLLEEDNYLISNAALETLSSYGLIKIRPSIELDEKKRSSLYSSFEKSLSHRDLIDEVIEGFGKQEFFSKSNYDIITNRGSVILTDLGFDFCSIVFSSGEE